MRRRSRLALSAAFYLGVPDSSWLDKLKVPMFVSRVRLQRVQPKSWPKASAPYALDSGAFSEISTHGEWRISAKEYAQFVGVLVERVGEPDFVAPQDYMCEPWIVSKTGLSVEEHLQRTVTNFCQLRSLLGARVIPVLQGYGPRDYERCADLYASSGIDLATERLVGVGSVCRRSGTKEANRLLRHLCDLDNLHLHAFGIKGATWRACRHFLASADSMAWSFGARKRGGDPNSPVTAIRWRMHLLQDSVLASQQRERARVDGAPGRTDLGSRVLTA